jgi:hypothetical protein
VIAGDDDLGKGKLLKKVAGLDELARRTLVKSPETAIRSGAIVWMA